MPQQSRSASNRLHLNGQTLADEGAPGETCRSIPTRSPVKFKRHRNTMLKSQNQSHDEYLETVRTQQLADGADGEQGGTCGRRGGISQLSIDPF